MISLNPMHKKKQAGCILSPLYGEPYFGSTFDVMALRKATSTCSVDSTTRRYTRTQIVIHTILGCTVAPCSHMHPSGTLLSDVKIYENGLDSVMYREIMDCDNPSFSGLGTLYKKGTHSRHFHL